MTLTLRLCRVVSGMLGLALTACGGPTGAAPPEIDPEWVTVAASYPRYLHTQRRLNLETTNHLTTDLLVSGHVLRAEHFTDVPVERDGLSRVWAGARVDIQSDFGEVASCEEVGPLRAWVEYEYTTAADPTPRTAVIAVDPAPLDEIRDRECGQRVVREAVDIRFRDPTRTKATIDVVIAVDRLAGGEPVTVHSMLGSVIFAMFGPDEPLLHLDEGDPGGVIPVEFRVSRCDPHVVSQSSKTYEFTVWVGVGNRPLQATPIDVDPALRVMLDDLLATCMAGEG